MIRKNAQLGPKPLSNAVYQGQKAESTEPLCELLALAATLTRPFVLLIPRHRSSFPTQPVPTTSAAQREQPSIQ
ncbi:MAG: hypothetical protein ABIR62_14030 [Dokdonella sp.]|uniref:hypothetical protein n=1 Tax=Dokdonella sp. TaxID=2291710 RepID=UPI00326756CE